MYKPGVTPEKCFGSDFYGRALAETNMLHGTNYDMLPEYFDESGDQKLAPADVVADFKRLYAKYEMESCPLDDLIIPEAPEEGTLSIDLMPEWNAWDLLNSPWAQLPVREPPPETENETED